MSRFCCDCAARSSRFSDVDRRAALAALSHRHRRLGAVCELAELHQLHVRFERRDARRRRRDGAMAAATIIALECSRCNATSAKSCSGERPCARISTRRRARTPNSRAHASRRRSSTTPSRRLLARRCRAPLPRAVAAIDGVFSAVHAGVGLQRRRRPAAHRVYRAGRRLDDDRRGCRVRQSRDDGGDRDRQVRGHLDVRRPRRLRQARRSLVCVTRRTTRGFSVECDGRRRRHESLPRLRRQSSARRHLLGGRKPTCAALAGVSDDEARHCHAPAI